MERLRELSKGYKPEDTWNEDETGCFSFVRFLTKVILAEEGRRCQGGKKSKLRMTVAFFVKAKGEKEEPIVIWLLSFKSTAEALRLVDDVKEFASTTLQDGVENPCIKIKQRWSAL